ncbi:MAG: hypothetical protein QGH48_04330 [Candidatus Poseidoniia archaeon]|nr:hypothetical protein [Candidatus Poseidoniia archaeon]MDP6592316.1 hypothetical protein [Candidatus Poseidoniia archaeon]MDP7096173.1 hypothetical protein [Candidatus Poseidoniia archaeon]MDP7187450.1 hypothetical protein [Candidatus Poseidoniia archaeon]MDP7444928.1 hypothetical protein [Candidatus Poseidoniia archaeon]
MHITEVNEVLEKVSKGELTTEDAQKLLGTYKDEELGKELRNVPGKEQLEIFAIILVLMLLELMYDSLFIYGILENWDQQFLSFTIAMAFLVLGLMLDFYRRSFMPEVLEAKKRRRKVITKLER